MKWYSIKKYHPSIGCELLIRAVKHSNITAVDLVCYEKYFVAELECIYEGIEDIRNWYLSNGAIADSRDGEYKVTHFAVLDPVEIEE